MNGEFPQFTRQRDLSVVGAVGDAHRQLMESMGRSPYSVFPEDHTLVLRIRKGKGEMDVEIAIEPPQQPSLADIETAIEKVIAGGTDPDGIRFYDTIRHQPYIREWLPKDDPGRSYIITQYLYKGEVVHTVGHASEDNVKEPDNLILEPDLEKPRIIWLGAISRQSRTMAEESFDVAAGYEGAAVVPGGSEEAPA